MNRNEIKQFFAKRDAAWQRHDVAAITANHAEDCEVQSPLAGKVKGLQAIEEIYAGWFSSFTDAKYSTESLLIDGNQAAQIVRMTGNHTGNFCGLEPTGKAFNMQCVFLYWFSEGKIVREIRIYDFTALLLQLGVLKAKPAF
jgi:steroid delta-isomerase-like uncharacterized protein